MDADMYAGSSYAPTSNAGTASATQTPSPKATSTGSFTGAASNKSDDGPGYGQPYNPAATLYSNTATALTNAGVNLTPPTQASYNPMNLYSSQSMAEISTEINDYLRNTAIDDAMREALGIPEVYQGIPTAEEPEPNIDMSVLQGALMPEPITVEELPEDKMFEGMDGSYMFEEEVTVKAGDTLTAIAEANNLPVQDVIDANPQIANPDMIRPGQKVNLTKRLDTKGETPARELPEVLSIPEAAAYMGKERATLIMKGIDKLFGLVPPKTDIEKKAKSELEYFLDAQPESSLPDFFKYVPDKVQLAEYIKGRAERKKAAGTMNFSDRSALTYMDNLQLVDIEDAQPAGLMSSRFDSKGATGLTTFYEDIGKKAESDHGSTPVPTKDARETKEYIDGKLNPNYIADPEDRSKDVGYGHKVTAAEEASGKIRGVTFKNEDGTYKELTEEDKVTILNADMQAHTKAALDAGWETKLSNIGTSWNELDPSYQRALTSLAYNVGGKKAGEDWTAVLRAAKDRNVTEFARHLRRQDAGRYTAGMDNRVMKELKFAGLIDKRRDVASVLPLADRRSGIAN
jgi:LysM repeat protein/GH24 family phage-related lysozyme (muramidase)